VLPHKETGIILHGKRALSLDFIDAVLGRWFARANKTVDCLIFHFRTSLWWAARRPRKINRFSRSAKMPKARANAGAGFDLRGGLQLVKLI
jgi:hypothetical protein